MQADVKQLSPHEIRWMVENGDHRDIGEIRRLNRQGVDVRADSPAFATKEPATPTPAPAKPTPAASNRSSGPAPLSEHQAKVLKSVMGQQSGPRPQAQAQAQGGGDFEAQVNAHQEQHGCKRSESIQAVADSNPELHRQWLIAQQPGDPAPAAQTPGKKASEHQFWAEARQYATLHGVSMSKALSELARQKPDLHKQFLRDVQ
ncbi:MAG: hypothetical protein ACLFPB_08735 [Desulfovermiculus sp.]